MATTDSASTNDQTLLYLFCGEKYVVVDDYGINGPRDVFQRPTPIARTWPRLADYAPGGGAAGEGDGEGNTFATGVDAVYYEEKSSKLVFFKGDSCAIQNCNDNTWEFGLITDYYDVPPLFAQDIDGAVVGRSRDPNVATQLFLLKNGQYASGQSVEPGQGSKVSLLTTGTETQAGWPVSGADITAAAAYVYPPDSQTWESTLFVTQKQNAQISSASDYKVMFYQSTSKDAAPNQLWPSYASYPIDAATRLNPATIPDESGADPDHKHGHHHGHGGC
ncbi:hypothetical protein [Bordetella flabilis]|uniref:Uncharacterized protein n=1 Tax=Bordetella flabilis TaxID=463014 RepID=A0A193GH64_9BORD|nr:hypothetical protein [Bordetella flabilis]ANN78634.1 hypothetical protein BAU07_17290 [Bordetella flabilis]